MKRVDCVGKVFGRLTVVSETLKLMPSGRQRSTYCLCRCECGSEKEVHQNELRRGHVKSCGCLIVDVNKERSTTHGHSTGGRGSRVYAAWNSMRDRCCNSNHRQYQYYGGRGITVCDRWMHSFDNFLSDMGEPIDGLSLDRKDNSKGYCKENCRWATRTEQQRNRRNTVILEFDGTANSLPYWAEYAGVKVETLRNRIFQLGWSVDRALTTPVNRRAS